MGETRLQQRKETPPPPRPPPSTKDGSSQPLGTSLLMRFITDHRGLIMVMVVVPLSFVWEWTMFFRDLIYRKFLVSPELHDARVKEVQAQVKRWHESSLRGVKPMCTARREWLSMSTRTATFKEDCSKIELGKLRDILFVDTEKNIVRAEPLVNMRYMTDHLLPLGRQLAVQVEMEELTVGGLCLGLGMETTSHVSGLIQETVIAYEVVLSDGALVRATKTSHSDLFFALPWSHGSLGFLVAVELRIIPTKPCIRLTYTPCHTKEQLESTMRSLALSPQPPTFLEATVYSKETSVIMHGTFAEYPTGQERRKVNRLNYFWKQWFFLHCQQALEKGEFQEYVPARHYYHRYTRGVFWEMRDLIPFGNSPWYRYLLAWMGAPKISLIKLTMSPQIRQDVVYKHVVQDIIIPLTELSRSIDLFDSLFEIYPLLVFPIAIFKHQGKKTFIISQPEGIDALPGKDKAASMFFDLGAYGVPQKVRENRPWSAYQAIRAMEAYTRDVNGYQCLYSDTFMTRSEFRDMFDHTLLDQMRQALSHCLQTD
ncbi:unnamed protein product [Chrysoparadoxa australica]